MQTHLHRVVHKVVSKGLGEKVERVQSCHLRGEILEPEDRRDDFIVQQAWAVSR